MITVLVPSRGRPKLARRLRDTWNMTRSMPNTKIRFYLNDDDPCLEEYVRLINRKEYIIGPDQATCFSWNQLAHSAVSRGDEYCMLVGDDAVRPQRSNPVCVSSRHNSQRTAQMESHTAAKCSDEKKTTVATLQDNQVSQSGGLRSLCATQKLDTDLGLLFATTVLALVH